MALVEIQVGSHRVTAAITRDSVEELGLVDYLAGRFAIAGTAAQCRHQLQELADAGVDCVFLNGAMRNEERMIVSMAEKVGVSFHPGHRPRAAVPQADG